MSAKTKAILFFGFLSGTLSTHTVNYVSPSAGNWVQQQFNQGVDHFVHGGGNSSISNQPRVATTEEAKTLPHTTRVRKLP